MLIEKLYIEEFRGIKRLAKPLELGRFTVLIGRNNVGKTAILEALYMLTAPEPAYVVGPYAKNPRILISELHGGGGALIYGYHGKALIRYELRNEVLVEDKRIKSVELELSTDSYSMPFLKIITKYDQFYKALGVKFGDERDILALYVPNNSESFNAILDFAKRSDVLRWAEKEGHNARVAELVSKAVYDNFTEVLLRGNELCLRKVGPRGPMYIDLKSVGEGIKRFVLVYYAVEYINPRIVLWDDIEVAAHPSLLDMVVKWLANSNRQVVVATHSIDVLYSLAVAKPKDCMVIVLKKMQDDVVDWRALTLDEVEELLTSSIDPRKIVDEA